MLFMHRVGLFFLIIFFCLFIVVNGYSQTVKLSGIVRDKHSEEQIPFASVKFKKSGKGMLTDSAGKFTILLRNSAVNDTLEVFSVGYKVIAVPVATIKDSLFITLSIEVLPPSNEAVVKVKYNRALWFWKKIMSNKYKTDKKFWDNYSYEIYNKLELDINNIDKDKVAENPRLIAYPHHIVSVVVRPEDVVN